MTFNDHDGSTKSYAHTREHKVEVVQADFVPHADEISAEYQEGSAKNVMRHDGSWVKFRKLAKDYDPINRDAACTHIRDHQRKGGSSPACSTSRLIQRTCTTRTTL